MVSDSSFGRSSISCLLTSPAAGLTDTFVNSAVSLATSSSDALAAFLYVALRLYSYIVLIHATGYLTHVRWLVAHYPYVPSQPHVAATFLLQSHRFDTQTVTPYYGIRLMQYKMHHITYYIVRYMPRAPTSYKGHMPGLLRLLSPVSDTSHTDLLLPPSPWSLVRWLDHYECLGELSPAVGISVGPPKCNVCVVSTIYHSQIVEFNPKCTPVVISVLLQLGITIQLYIQLKRYV